MRRLAAVALALALAPAARAERVTMDQSVSLAMQQNRDAIAARLDIDAAELDRVQARLYPNPVLSYTVGNLVVGAFNPENGDQKSSPGFFGQTVHNLSVTEVIDVWAKRNAHIRLADASLEHRRLMVEDALREIAYAVRSAFADLLRETSELALARETRNRYDQTIQITRSRFNAGDISETELKKIELEGLRYLNGVIDAEMQFDLARQKLAALCGLEPRAVLEPEEPQATRERLDLDQLTERAMQRRPDLRAAQAAHGQAEAAIGAARRDALPDLSLGVGFTHSEFTVSGDNPNSLALSLSLPVPLFDRNQANIGRARLDLRRADNDLARLGIAIRHEVADAVRRSTRSFELLRVFEDGGMLERADTALRVAEKSYKAGSLSLLELLEAQRTYIETRAQYLHALYDYRQATVDVGHAVGGDWK
jgi:cobalt-zinc-cadmium efflux system outer membrane protein